MTEPAYLALLANIEEKFDNAKPFAERMYGIKDWGSDFKNPGPGGTNYFAKRQAERDVKQLQLELVKLITTRDLISVLDALAGRLLEK